MTRPVSLSISCSAANAGRTQTSRSMVSNQVSAFFMSTPLWLHNLDSDAVAGVVQIAAWVPARYDHWLHFALLIGGAGPYFVITCLRETDLCRPVLPGKAVAWRFKRAGLPCCTEIDRDVHSLDRQVARPGMSVHFYLIAKLCNGAGLG